MRKNIINIFLYLVLTLILAGAISFVMTHYYGFKFIDALFWIGIISLIVGAMSSIGGVATGTHIGGDNQYQSFVIMETLRSEKESPNYVANFKKNAVFDPKISGLSLIFAGVILFFISYFLS